MVSQIVKGLSIGNCFVARMGDKLGSSNSRRTERKTSKMLRRILKN